VRGLRRRPARGAFLSRFAIVSVGRIVAAVLQAVCFLLLARAVSPAEFGLFASALGVITVAQTVVDLGVTTYAIRERATRPTNGHITSALRVSNLLSITLCLLLTALTFSLAIAFDDSLFLLLPLAVTAAAERNADGWLGVVFADGDAWINVSNLVVRRLAVIPLFLLASQVGTDGLLAYSLSSASIALLSALFAHAVVSPRLPPREPIPLRSLLRLTWPYWLASVATQARNLDSIITTLIAGATAAGFYSTASRLTSPLRILPTSLATVLLPEAARRRGERLRPLLRLSLGASAGQAGIYFGLALSAPWLVVIALGDAYSGAVIPTQIVIGSLAFSGSAALFGSLLQGAGAKVYVANVALATTAICLTVVALGAALAGAVGAACGLALSFALQWILLLIRALRLTQGPAPAKPDTQPVKGATAPSDKEKLHWPT
jgi:O-antigen/teichoic acid export membrane protein